MDALAAQIMIRPAYGDDYPALARLAALDSADRIPPRPVLIAEVDGELRSALSLCDGSAVADPFFPSAGLLALLRAHAESPKRTRRRRRRPPVLSFDRG